MKSLEVWDEAEPSVKLGAMAVVYIDAKRDLQVDRGGAKGWRQGATVGLLAHAFLGGTSGNLAFMGASIGGLDTNRLGVSRAELARLGKQLEEGKAILAVLCDDYEQQATEAELARLGAQVVHYPIPADVVQQVTTTTQQAVDAGTLTPQTMPPQPGDQQHPPM
jgi:hypothetical protein